MSHAFKIADLLAMSEEKERLAMTLDLVEHRLQSFLDLLSKLTVEQLYTLRNAHLSGPEPGYFRAVSRMRPLLQAEVCAAVQCQVVRRMLGVHDDIVVEARFAAVMFAAWESLVPDDRRMIYGNFIHVRPFFHYETMRIPVSEGSC